MSLLIISQLVHLQVAAIIAMVPTALATSVSPGQVAVLAVACYGYYILPTYPSDIAMIQFDCFGTTWIGKYMINHRCICPS